jgi:cyclophilin family peptidyl-prolyl cis-trans isomerase
MWGGDFEGGIPDGLYHFSGAVAYANSQGTSTNGSQFYIVNTEAVAPSFEGLPAPLPANVVEKYKEVGGVPYLDGSYTVFGQVFEGMDVVRAIGDVPRNESDKPLTQVVIESLTIEDFAG